jgi:spore coat polysaccharide biosynthesis protein SpsF (cytidylyltransferase family)
MNFLQCEITCNETKQVEWLPEKFAKKGYKITIKPNSDFIMCGSVVQEVTKVFNKIKITEEEVLKLSEYVKTHRKGADV